MKRLASLTRLAAVVAVLTLAVTATAAPAWAGLDTWTWRGPEGGPIRAVLVDPATPSTIYVGTQGSGVFKSTDTGATWTPVGPTLASRTVRALVTDGAGTLFAGVEDAHDAESGGVYQSTDGGANWTPMDAGLTNKNVQALAWDGTSLYAGTREESGFPDTGGVFKWNGATWEQVNGTAPPNNLDTQSARRVQAFAIDSRLDPPVVYAGTQGQGIFKSVDGGASWLRIDNPPNQGFKSDCLEQPEILALAVDETIALVGTSGAVLYIGATGKVGDLTTQACSETPANGGGQGQGAGFFRYVPFGGQTCTGVEDEARQGCTDRRMQGAFVTLVPETLSTQVWAIALKTNANPTRIYIGTDLGVFASNDSAGSWAGVPGIAFPDGLKGMPIRALGIDPAASCPEGTVRLHAGSGGRGMFHRCPNVPIGELPFTEGNSGLTALRAQSLAIGVRGGVKALLAGLVGGGVISTIDGGASWQETGEDSRTVHGLAVDPTDLGVVYAATARGVLRSEDGGDTFVPASTGLPTQGTLTDPTDPPRPVRAILVDPANPNVVYAAVSGVHRSVDGGATWTAVNGSLPTTVTCGATCPGNGTVVALALDRGPGTNATWGTLYIGTDQGVYRSTDGGASWTLVSAGVLATALAIDPVGGSGPTLYAGTGSGTVFRSIAGGAFNNFSSGLPGQAVSALVVRLGAPSTIVAGLDGGGVYSTPATSAAWTAMNDGLTSLDVMGLALDAAEATTLWAATRGRGMLDFEFANPSPPFVGIISPTPPVHDASASPVLLQGSASGGTGVAQVLWSTNRGEAGLALGINPWDANVDLHPGANVVTVTAVGTDGSRNIAVITVNLPSAAPDTPTGLGQFRNNGATPIAVGGTTEQDVVVLKGTVSDPGGDTVKLQVEVRPVGTAFSDTPTHESGLGASGGEAAVTVSGLAGAGYHWQARAMNSQGGTGAWAPFGGNGEASPDFTAGACHTGVTIDNLAPGQTSARIAFTGTWSTAPEGGAFGSNASLVSAGPDADTYVFKTPFLSTAQTCSYEVWVWYTAAATRATNVPVRVINNTGGPSTKRFNQQINGGQWRLHGTYTFAPNVKAKVKVLNKNGEAAADAVQFVLVP